jgi:hypothetical protein
VFQELLAFFAEGAKIAPDMHDLSSFLAPHRVYRVIRIREKSFKDCAYKLVDDFPEFTRACGMLRYYRSPGDVYWTEVEKAENILSDAMTMDVYGWTPDAFTLFEDALPGTYELVVILAF